MLTCTGPYDSVANQQVLTPFEFVLVIIIVCKIGHICFYGDAFHKATVSLKFSSRIKSKWVSSSGHKAWRRWGQAVGYQWPWCQGDGTSGKRPENSAGCPAYHPPPPTPVLQPLLCPSDYFLLGSKLDDFHRGPNGVVKICTFPTGILEFQMSKEGKWYADEWGWRYCSEWKPFSRVRLFVTP